jgi:hypothetical protein
MVTNATSVENVAVENAEKIEESSIVPCVVCAGTGRAPSGLACSPCEGTGDANFEPSPGAIIRYRRELEELRADLDAALPPATPERVRTVAEWLDGPSSEEEGREEETLEAAGSSSAGMTLATGAPSRRGRKRGRKGKKGSKETPTPDRPSTPETEGEEGRDEAVPVPPSNNGGDEDSKEKEEERMSENEVDGEVGSNGMAATAVAVPKPAGKPRTAKMERTERVEKTEVEVEEKSSDEAEESPKEEEAAAKPTPAPKKGTGKAKPTPAPKAPSPGPKKPGSGTPKGEETTEKKEKVFKWSPKRVAIVKAMRELGATKATLAKLAEEIAAKAGEGIRDQDVKHYCYKDNDLVTNGYVAVSFVPDSGRRIAYYLTPKGVKAKID